MEQISVFDIFKIGVGPSSSHTMGPWCAAQQFLEKLRGKELISIQVKLYGSLSKTGKGHGTDIAILLGLTGHNVKTIAVNKIDKYIQEIKVNKRLDVNGSQLIDFSPSTNIEFLQEKLPFHPNGMSLIAGFKDGSNLEETYYSIGGGFVVQENQEKDPVKNKYVFPYPIASEKDLLKHMTSSKLDIYNVVYQNELALKTEDEINKSVSELWAAMKFSIYNGCHKNGILPGGLNVVRRAFNINVGLIEDEQYTTEDEWIMAIKNCDNSFSNVTKWVSCFALAVNEENAAFGRVVTAPTNGAAGVIPAVLLYMLCFTETKANAIKEFILVAGEIGSLFKKGSTISAAMGGCQAEIGVSSAMAAAGLTYCMGGSSKQVLQAAEIAMEHHLGLTCDPIMGLVQVPCIERNTMGAMKAITASQIALAGSPEIAKVTLDQVIKTMKETAAAMSDKFKETSEGGLAVNISVAVSEC
ncbi:L-serine ammonia-lyase [Flavicella sp.]|uniref:L-serine ammonia-lyase n=1 Tax=Flavicella sp. TaxID=2957742 RepID=UPI00301AA351